jgi:glycosyltransferase involved in cell wall biosynthesis
MKVAIIHDYIKEYGGAERVLEAITEVFPEAPIYTAFCDQTSVAFQHFKNKKIITSWFQKLPAYAKLASPLRFLTPLIWGSFNFSGFDLVISSASWFITKGFGSNHQSSINNQKLPLEICYCHTPPRWLYGYATSVNFKKYWLIRIYAAIVGHFLRIYDFKRAQKVNYFIANSKETKERIKKFYRRDSTVIYPPATLSLAKRAGPPEQRGNYYFIVSRIVGSKGIEMAIEAALKLGFKLKIAGSEAGYYSQNDLVKKAEGKVEFLGQVSDEELSKLYIGAKGFLALAKDEDFGITPVESQSLGTPVIAFNGGGYKETVIDRKTGILFDNYSAEGLVSAIKIFEKTKFNSKDCIENAQKFSKERFIKEIKEFVASKS